MPCRRKSGCTAMIWSSPTSVAVLRFNNDETDDLVLDVSNGEPSVASNEKFRILALLAGPPVRIRQRIDLRTENSRERLMDLLERNEVDQLNRNVVVGGSFAEHGRRPAPR